MTTLSEATPLQCEYYDAHKARQALWRTLRPPPELPKPCVAVRSPIARLLEQAEISRQMFAANHMLDAVAEVEKVEPRIFVRDIIKACADHWRVTVLDIKSSRRPMSIVVPRQVGMYLSRQLTKCSLPEIGRIFGGRDHTTILHAVNKITRLLQTDDELRAAVEAIKGMLTPAEAA